eukprot:TRINITY_DN3823_c0_g1_i3.p1 TRINITY_DN3823_c0_g1~~TRINITY_DN3823_c0_g1_i3.p1  ORF type:complete len:1445 (-),score=432.44 TRINITY_DN3823_c0_g1_i3:36-4370(-)
MGDLIVPLAYCNWTSPHHWITSMMVSPDKNFLVTGASNGRLFMWNLRHKSKEWNVNDTELHNIVTEQISRKNKESPRNAPPPNTVNVPTVNLTSSGGASAYPSSTSTTTSMKKSNSAGELYPMEQHSGQKKKLEQKIGEKFEHFKNQLESKIIHQKESEDRDTRMLHRRSGGQADIASNVTTAVNTAAASPSLLNVAATSVTPSPRGHRRQISRDNVVVTTNILGNRKKKVKEEDKVGKRPRISLRCVLIGHTAAVTAITSVVYNTLDSFISVSSDGSLCIWSYYDGRCLMSFDKLLKCSPTSLQLLPDGYHLACSGRHSDVEIVNLKTLKVSMSLSGHQQWVTSIYACDLKTGEAYSPILITASVDVIQFWSMKKGEQEHPLQSICLEIDEPLAIALAPNFRSLLIVTAKRWMLLTAKDHTEIANVPCPDSEWVGGSFYGSRTVIVWSKEGNSYMYPIPSLGKAPPLSFSLKNAPKPVGISESQDLSSSSYYPIPNGNTNENEDDEVVVESPKQQPANWRSALLMRLNVIDKSNGTRLQPSCIFCTNISDIPEDATPGENFGSSTDSQASLSTNDLRTSQNYSLSSSNRSNLSRSGTTTPREAMASSQSHGPPPTFVTGVFGRILISGSTEGRVNAWIIPSRLDKLGDVSRVLPWAVTDPAEGFPESTSSHQSKVTTSIVVEEIPLLVLGHNNGTITIMSIPTMTNEKSKPQLAHNGPVTSLLSFVDARHSRLVSGGSDFYIRVWNIKDNSYLQALWQFTYHTGTIMKLFSPPPSDIPIKLQSTWKNTFFSVSQDKTVGLFSLDGMTCKHVFGAHSTFISRVKWQVEQDYLLVECVDGSVSIWEMSTGIMDGCVHGETATSIMEAASPLSPQYGDYSDVLEKNFSTFSVGMGGGFPIQLVLLNVKNLLKDLTAALKSDPALTKSGATRSSILSSPPTSLAYKLFTYFLPWGIDSGIDELCKTQLLLQPPNPEVTFAVTGYEGKVTVLVPSAASGGSGRWQFSEFLSSLHTISAVAYSKALMSIPFIENACSQLLSFYCSILPDKLNYFVDPSLGYLAGHWRDPVDDVMQASRSILVATASRMDADSRKAFARSCATQMKENPDSKIQSILTLAICGSQYPDCLDRELSALVTQELLKIVQDENQDSSNRILAAELLGKGFQLWRQYISDIEHLIQHLFVLTFEKDGSANNSSSSTSGAAFSGVPNNNTLPGVAHHSLMLIGSAEPKQFVISLGKYILNVQHPENPNPRQVNMSQHAAAIHILTGLIKQDPIALLPLLPRLVETVVKSLDPHLPYLRESCLGATTRVLHILVKQYPMVSFHQESQHLAVGTKEAVIAIYDLKTATTWHVLEGHNGPISAIAFSANGKMLASYSIQDAEVRIWQTTSSLLGILGSSPHCIRTMKINRVDRNLSQMNLLECVRLKWSSPNAVTLMRDWEGSLTFKV